MNTATIKLQLGEKELTKAQTIAREWGFSSVEEVMREFVRRFLSKTQTKTSRQVENVKLTKKAKLRYKRINQDLKSGKNIMLAKSVDDFLIQLNA